MGRNINFAPDEYYHIYNRGTEKRNIFSSVVDHERFIALLRVANGTAPVHLQLQGRTLKDLKQVDFGEALVDIGAYCLMPNHFHLLLKERDSGGISKFMQKLTTAYTMYFNKKYERTGALFQGKYKAQQILGDRYLKYIFSYIHLNPVKLIDADWKENGLSDIQKALHFLRQYTYSSYLDYRGNKRPHATLLSKDAFPNYFSTKEKFDAEIVSWLEFGKEI